MDLICYHILKNTPRPLSNLQVINDSAAATQFIHFKPGDPGYPPSPPATGAGRVKVVFAGRDIEEGELITFSYFGSRSLQTAPVRRLSTRNSRLFSCGCDRCAQQIDTVRGLPCPACWSSSPKHARYEGRGPARGALVSMIKPGAVPAFGRDARWDEPWARVAQAQEAGRADCAAAAAGFLDPPAGSDAESRDAAMAATNLLAGFDFNRMAASPGSSTGHISGLGQPPPIMFSPSERLGFVYYDPVLAGEPPAVGTAAAASAAASEPGAPTAGAGHGRDRGSDRKTSTATPLARPGLRRRACRGCAARAAVALPMRTTRSTAGPTPALRCARGSLISGGIPGLVTYDVRLASQAILGLYQPLPELLAQGGVRIDVAASIVAMAIEMRFDRGLQPTLPDEEHAGYVLMARSALAVVAAVVGPRHAATKLLQLQVRAFINKEASHRASI